MAREPQTQSKPTPLSRIAVACGGIVFAAFVALAIRAISDGRIFVDKWAADTAFVFDIILRIQAGQVPHVDFTLHLGALPYLMAAAAGGATVAEGFLSAQAMFTFLCLLIGVWIWHTRLSPISGPLLLLFVFVLGMTISIPTMQERSLALFYNRWGWVLTLLFACQTLLPSRSLQWHRLDGAVAGLLAFALLMTKVTFFVGLLPAALLCTALRGQWREIVWGLVAFLLLVALCLVTEPMMLPGYIENISWAAVNPLRPNAGTGLTALLSGPAFIGYTAVFVVFLIAVLRTKGPTEAIWLAVAAVGFYFIQYQNFLTAPFWVLFLSLYATLQINVTSSPVFQRIWAVLALAFLVFSATLLTPMVQGLRVAHAPDGLLPFSPEGGITTGAYFPADTLTPIQTENRLNFPTEAPWTDNPECDFITGWAGATLEISETIADLPGPAFVTDSISPHWFLAGVEPVPGVALWNYGSVRGIESSEFVVVPKCAIKPNFKREILRELERQQVPLVLERETERASVYRISG